MKSGPKRGKHLSPDKDYRNEFNPDGLTKLGYANDPVVQTTVSGEMDSNSPTQENDVSSPRIETSIQPYATTQIIQNPGFENGSANPAPWVATAGVIDSSTGEAPHTGAWKAWLDGYGTTHTDTLYQQVAISSTATAATLTFWLHIDTAETGTTAYDKLSVQVKNSAGTTLQTLATYSNANAAAGYQQRSFDLTSYKGQTIRIYLAGTEDASLQTSFVVDDFALNVTTSSPTPTPTPTPTGTPTPTPTPIPTPTPPPSAGLNFDGLGAGGGYTPNAAPPDTNGAIGATQYVQWVNEAYAVYSKTTGARLAGPINGNQLFQALGATHQCAATNDGDPIVQYDKANNRWVLTQFAVTNGATKGYYQCIAVSQTSDATGAYNLYAYKEPNFNDYPKFGVWADGYYATYNMFNGNTFTGARLCAYDRAKMLTGAAANEQCFQLTSSYGGVLPADLDGNIAPPAGAPEYFVNFGSNSLNTWKYHVDFTTPANSTLTGPTVTTVAAFSEACAGQTCIPQAGTTQQLDSLGDRLMYRLAYRHFADGHEAMVVNHSVNPGTGPVSGVRWYELRISAVTPPMPPSSGGTPSLFQQGTYAVGSDSRWMGSIAMDKVGNIGLAYSVSSGSINPSIRYTSRVPTDGLGTMGAETSIIAGTGSQLATLSRWGDYSALTVDPVDDCTFWYTTEYLKTSGTFNWSTRIASFKLPSCQ
ncbi:MAG: hypothetical protein M3033_18450 [Acidobacteriota bacterium]|nr:hypothetical protein [Acidobacteriota bacterium]